MCHLRPHRLQLGQADVPGDLGHRPAEGHQVAAVPDPQDGARPGAGLQQDLLDPDAVEATITTGAS